MPFKKGLSIFQADFKNKEEAIEALADLLFTKHVVDSIYKKSVLEREKVFPTGLPTVPYGIAIPHAESANVIETQIAFASLKKPITFQCMGSSREEVDVSIIFMLAVKHANDHLEMLQKLIDLFQDKIVVSNLANCKNQKDLNRLLTSVLVK